MTLLILNARFSRDSQNLRRSAQQLGWETLRLEGWALPDWVETNESDLVIFATMPEAQSIAEKFSQILLGCGADWLPGLPYELRKRKVERSTLTTAVQRAGSRFIKSAITKHLAGKVWTFAELEQAAERLPANLAVYIAEPVKFIVEYRCFVANGNVATLSPYRRFDQWFDDSVVSMGEPNSEREEALQFAQRVLENSGVETPPAFVLDVGIIEGRGWAVVEANECWASGIYHCDPSSVLAVLRHACIADHPARCEHLKWNFADHYAAAVTD